MKSILNFIQKIKNEVNDCDLVTICSTEHKELIFTIYFPYNINFSKIFTNLEIEEIIDDKILINYFIKEANICYKEK